MKTIIELAREAGYPDSIIEFAPKSIERFAALVAAQERERCAQVCDVQAKGWKTNPGLDNSGYIAANNCAEAIRSGE